MIAQILPHGTRLERAAGRLVRVIGCDGAPQVALAWDGDRLAAALVAGYAATLAIDGALGDHPVLGAVHTLAVDGRPVAAMSALDWARPTAIPAIDRPAALPAGAGTLLLTAIARLAQDAGVAALRYAGPYPTDALWASLAPSFRTDGRAADFTATAATRWTGRDRAPIAIDFAPAPFERATVAPGVHVQLRDGLERAIVDGAAYDRGAGVRRLVPDGDGWAAALWFGDRHHATAARFTAGGALVDRTALPAPTGDPVGQVLPPALVAALGSLVAELVPAPLADAAPAALAAVPIVWGDPGPAAAADRGDRLVLHAALWHALAPHGLARVALALAEALAPLAAARAVSASAPSPSR